MENVTMENPMIHPWVYVWRYASDKTNYKRTISPRHIIEVVSVYYETQGIAVSQALLLGRSRKAMYVVPRYMMWYFIYNYSAKQSLKSIGLMFNRDHSTVINGIKRIKNYCETEPQTRAMFYEICELLKVDEYEKVNH